MPEVSIIIPIYNTPPQVLQRCFDSVAAIEGVSFEAILVDDGSGEDTSDFCKEYTRRHSHFRYFYKENGGVSSARNAGIAEATGCYIAFLDADDALLGQSITADLFATDSELVIMDILLSTNGSASCWHALDVPAGAVDQGTLLRQLVVSKSMNSPCAKLFRRDSIEKIGLRFCTEHITGEDWLFVCQYVLQIQSALYCPTNGLIYYRDGASSLSRVARQPDVMLSNLHAIYQRQLSLCNMDWATQETCALKSIAAAQWLEHLFNISADLTLLGKLTAQRMRQIRQAAQEAAQRLSSGAKKARIKATVLLHLPILIGPLARLRQLYLRLRC